MSETVVCAMSGGVDSSVTAYLLKQQGYDVIGLTMKIWSSQQRECEKSCCGTDAVDDARRVAAQLDIPFYALDMEDVFRDTVIQDFVSEYTLGRTPNPCIVCNHVLKFGYLLERAKELGAEKVATGHYARIFEKNDRFCLGKGLDDTKDQSYFLYNLEQQQLSRILFPLGDFKKTQIREIAAEQGFVRVANKPESQDICFVSGDYRGFLDVNLKEPLKEGNFIDSKGNVLGRHRGIGYYTIGQRRGLGISFPQKMFVTKINPETLEVTLGIRDELLSNGAEVQNFTWVSKAPVDSAFDAFVKIRYQHEPIKSLIEPVGKDKVNIRFESPQESVTPGQAAVLYGNDMVLGGGVIEGVFD